MSNSIRKIMEMVADPETPKKDFIEKLWDLVEKYGVPEDIIQDLNDDYFSYGEARWEEGMDDEKESIRTRGQEY